MNRDVYANLNQGIDSFLRVAMTLRRKEVDIQSIQMIKDDKQNVGLQLRINEKKTDLNDVINHMMKLHDIKEIRIGSEYINKPM